MNIHRKYGSYIKTAAMVLSLLVKTGIKTTICAGGLLLAAWAINGISTDPWYQDWYWVRMKSGDLQVIAENPSLYFRSIVEGIALTVAVCIFFIPAPKAKLREIGNTLHVDIEW